MLTKRLRDLVRSFPAVVVVGARQVGKSTLLQATFGSKMPTVVFDPLIDVENARRDPELFLNNRPPPIILDEIQYAPELIAAIKRRIDKNREPGQYLMTGSQQWGVLQTMAESLAGRAVFLDLEGFGAAEAARARQPRPWLVAWLTDPEAFIRGQHKRLKTRYTVYEQLWRGWLPEAQFLSRKTLPDFHSAYQRTYMERDVRLLANVSDWQTFGRFLRLLAALTAQEINYNELGREIGLTAQTAKRWTALLQATFQWFEVASYHGSAIKRVSGKPKGYVADTGLACAAQAISSPEALGGHPLWGPLFETAVVSEVRKQIAVLSPKPNLYHWRSHGGAEVDLLLEYNGFFFPVEIKAASQPSRYDTRSLKAFRETYPKLKTAPGLVISPTERVIQLSEKDFTAPWDLER